MTMIEQEIRDALGDLRDRDVDPVAVDATLRRYAEETRRRPSRARRIGLAGAAVAAVLLTALAVLSPADRDPTGAPDRSAASLLLVAAARAAEQPGATFDGYRYSRIRDSFREPQIDARRCEPPQPAVPPGERAAAPAPTGQDCMRVLGDSTRESVREQWVDARWSGRLRTDGWKLVRADPPADEAELGDPADGPYEYGDGPLARVELRDLPTDPAQLEAWLRDVVRTQRFGPNGGRSSELPPRMVDYELVRVVIHLISEARVSPHLRAAAWTVLSRVEGARATGRSLDALGRPGETLEIATTYGPANEVQPSRHHLRVIFDPGEAKILSWTQRTVPPDHRLASEETHVIEAVGDVAATTERP